VAARFHEQLHYARRRPDRISIGCVAAPGAGDAFPGTAIWAMLCWEPGPRANGLSRGRRLGRTPPIDLQRNATGRPGVTRPSPDNPFRIRGATNGVGVPMARRTLQRAWGPSGVRLAGEFLPRKVDGGDHR
jgi:hypothetical protein